MAGSRAFPGTYTTAPRVDYSPIMEGGRAWERTFRDAGAAFGGAIEKYKLDKQERDLLEATITGKLADNPEVLKAIKGNEEMNKIHEGMGEGQKKGQLQKLAGFTSSFTAEQE